MIRTLCKVSVVPLVLALLGCAASVPPKSAPERVPVERLAHAQASVTAGCFSCLVTAFEEFEDLRSFPSLSSAATDGALQAALLLAIRETEFGVRDSAYLTRASTRLATNASLRASFQPLVDIVSTLSPLGASAPDDHELARLGAAARNRQTFTDMLRPRSDETALTAYLWIAENCGMNTPTDPALRDWLSAIPTWRDTPLLRYRASACGRLDVAALTGLVQQDGRFTEINYLLGNAALADQKISDAIELFQRAYGGTPEWPAISKALAHTYFASEEFGASLEFFEKTLALVPSSPDARLGKGRALTQLGRYEDAIAAFDDLLAQDHWYVGDARYWRAFNEAQLRRYEAAASDVAIAANYLTNSDVPKLAGIIAVHRQQFELARMKFEESRSRNARDCETQYYLALVLSEQRDWPAALTVLLDTSVCLDGDDQQLRAEIEHLRRTEMIETRRARQIGRRERQIAENGRMRATTWFNAAVAYFYLSRPADARAYAEKVMSDEEFGGRATELLSQLSRTTAK
jgi:tetratricopeptide (TPR) repeat protein